MALVQGPPGHAYWSGGPSFGHSWTIGHRTSGQLVMPSGAGISDQSRDHNRDWTDEEHEHGYDKNGDIFIHD